jgi:predicted metalloprotease with PDZ domain
MKYLIESQKPLTGKLNLQLETYSEGDLRLKLSAWRPGRYERQNFASYIYQVRAEDAVSGEILTVIKVGRNDWTVQSSSPRLIRVSWEYYARQLDAGGSWVDDDLFYVNPVNCLFYKEGGENTAWSLELKLPENYQVASGLKFENGLASGRSFFELADSPILAAAHLAKAQFQSGNSEHFIWAYGVEAIPENITEDFKKYTDVQIATMGDFPEPHYHYLLILLPRPHYHGVEHRNSTVVVLGPANEAIHGALYKELLGISSHELFHAWNILKIRPKEMLPYRYGEENYFDTGFVAEGFTTYYGDLFLRRAGVFTDEQYFLELESQLKRHFENYGYQNMSLAESSFDLWVDGYSNPAPHRKVSIYVKGCLAAFCLDVKIRKHSRNDRSLDTVVKKLWSDFGRVQKGYSYSDVVWLASEAAGADLGPFMNKLIYERTDLFPEIVEAFEYLGLQLMQDPAQESMEKDYGIRFRPHTQNMLIDNIAPGSPAESMLMRDDDVVHLEKRENELYLQVLRHGKELDFTLPKGEGYFRRFKIAEMMGSMEQRESRRKWSGE